ncbi:MAG: acyl carrier protein [Thermomicrobiales bacterium]
MNRNDVQAAVIRQLRRVAPEADPALLRNDQNQRDQLDIDSMDFLNFAIALHDELQEGIAETDYPRLATIDGCVNFIMVARSAP